MVQKSIKGLTLLLTIFIVACSHKDSLINEETTSAHVITIDDQAIANQKLSELIDEVFYVKLETNKASLIGNIGELIVIDHNIIVLDETGNQVLIFDEKGSFLTKIKNVGNGPEEHQEIHNITFDFDELLIMIASSEKFLWFDLEGNFVRAVSSRLGGAKDVVYLGDSKMAIYGNYIQLVDAQELNLLVNVSNKNMEIEKRMLPFNQMIIVENQTSLFSNFSLGKNKKLFITGYRPYIWEITAENIYPRYRIDFGAHALPSDYEDKYLTDRSLSSERVRDIEKEKGFARFRGGAVHITDDYLNFTYAESGRFSEVLYNQTSDQVIQFKLPAINDVDGTKYFANRTTYKDYFVSIASASSLMRGQKSLEAPNIELNKLVGSMNEDDNPVLRYVRYKKF